MATKSTEKRFSRYVQGGDSTVHPDRLGWWEREIFEKKNDDIAFTLLPRHHMRPDKVAYDVYGRTSLMWLVLQYNNIVDIATEFTSGKTITLPSQARVLLDLTNKQPG